MPEPRFAARLTRRIATRGAIPLATYMRLANAHYYATRDPFGVAGDFTTAPEISQMFGEMVGVALADAWQRSGAPAGCAYVELGPGRGTLADDAMRVLRRFGWDGPAVLVETSPVLIAAQRRRLPGARHVRGVADLPRGPMLCVANEFFDALPVRQYVRTPVGWREMHVGIDDDGRIVPHPFGAVRDAVVPRARRDAPVGTLVERAIAAEHVMRVLARRLATDGGAALVIDYGSDDAATGGTVQAVAGHRRVSPFIAPGEHDLSAHVDFARLAAVARRAGAMVAGEREQGGWLHAMGIATRAARLQAADPAWAGAVAAALHRLTDPGAMGGLFRVLGLTGGGFAALAGFA